MKIKLMTWNVLYKEKADNILSLVKKNNPDILCCQEITTSSSFNNGRNIPEEISRALDASYRYFQVLDSLETKPANMGNAIFSKHPIISERHLLVQRGQGEINYSAQNRGYIEIKTKIDDYVLTVGTTHLSYVDRFIETAARNKEADKLIDAISVNVNKFILSGDFNSLPTSRTISKIESFLKSAGPDYKQKTFTTKPFVHNDFEVNSLEYRLDFMFVTPDIKTISSKIIKTEFSDHLPIVAELEV